MLSETQFTESRPGPDNISVSKPSKRSTTQNDIAVALGLSQGSVSKALRNDPRIDQATRRRVNAMARQIGYQPNPLAAGLAHFRSNSKVKPVASALGWINAWPHPKALRTYREFDLYWKGASRAAENRGYRLEEFIVEDNMTLQRIEKILRVRGVSGILISRILSE